MAEQNVAAKQAVDLVDRDPSRHAGGHGVNVPADQPYGSGHPAVQALQERFGKERISPLPLVVNCWLTDQVRSHRPGSVAGGHGVSAR